MSKTETAAGPTPAAAAKRFSPLMEGDFHTSTEFVMPVVAVTPPVGTPLEHLLKPEYWSHVRGRFAQFAAGAIVRAMPKDHAWWAELLVTQAGQGFARVTLLRDVKLDPAAAAPLVPPGYDIHPLPSGKYRAVRLQGGVVLSDKCQTFEDALKVVRDDIRVLAA